MSWSMQYALVYGVQGALVHQDLHDMPETPLRYEALQCAATFGLHTVQGHLVPLLLLRASSPWHPFLELMPP